MGRRGGPKLFFKFANMNRTGLLIAGHLLLVNLFASTSPSASSVNAFSFWPSSRFLSRHQKQSVEASQEATALVSSSHTSSNHLSRHHKPPVSTSTTSTTTSTQMPPIELHFEINPDDLAAPTPEQRTRHQNHQFAETNNHLADELTTPNGSLILEDLVNQFERKFNQNKRAAGALALSGPQVAEGEQQQLIDPTTTTQRPQALHSGEADQRRTNRSASAEDEPAGEPTTQASQQPDQAGGHLLLDQELATPTAFRFSNSAQQLDALVEAPAEEPDPDRHIQYDAVPEQTHPPGEGATAWVNSSQIGHLADFRSQLADQAATSGGNSTLVLFGSPPNSTNALEAGPLVVAAAAASPLLKNVTHQQEQQQTGQPGRNQTFERRMALENDTSISQDESSSLGPTNQTARSTGGANLIQARSMSSAGQPRAPQHSKPPYASYNQFNHNTRSAGGELAGRQGEDASQQQQQQQQQQLANSINSISSHLAASNQDRPGSDTSSTRVAVASTTAKPPAERQPSSLGGSNANLQNQFSERQDQADAELERVANKLAPVNELVELNPIESSAAFASASHGAGGDAGATHSRYHMSGSSAAGGAALGDAQQQYELGSYPADSNTIVSRYQPAANDRSYELHQQHQQPAGTISLSEPANSISSYLQSAALDAAGPQEPAGSPSIPAGSAPLADLSPHRAHDVKSGAPSATNPNDERDSLSHVRYSDARDRPGPSTTVPPAPPQVHRKTIETLSNQIASSDSSLASSPSLGAAGAHHQHKERSPPASYFANQLNNRGATSGQGHHHGASPSGSYAASLVNVTAPMVLPLSATEAMEASLGAEQALQHHQQVRGGSSSSSPSTSGGQGRPQYFAVASEGQRHSPSSAHQSIYSRPANQFRPGLFAPQTSTPAPPTTVADSVADHLLGAAHQQHFAHQTSSPSLQTGLSTMSAAERERMRLGDGSLASSASPGSQQASGFRSPLGQFPTASAAATAHMLSTAAATGLPLPSSYLTGLVAAAAQAQQQAASSSTPGMGQAHKFASTTPPSSSYLANNTSVLNRLSPGKHSQYQLNSSSTSSLPTTTNGFITGSVSNSSSSSSSLGGIVSTNDLLLPPPGGVTSQHQPQQSGSTATGLNKRVFNLTRVEHISAECSNDLIRTIIIFNGTFKGIIYSSGYVRDSNCLYINGTGKTRYDFSIKLNQCGTLGRQETHPATGAPNEIRRRDQVMWNTLSIQYNPIIEQEWDEHFRVSCEYGSDFWKTISFSPFNVETNTGSPVVFTVDPPQCQMEILKGHGMVGPRQETITGPVTVGDPLTLLIHMKSEKAGYDILVKNCIAHNGGQQKMQLIDTNGCVVNERFISPFRGTYNDNDLKHVTLYSYLKAFRFTGSPVLYLECEVHMCQSACPPQMCYWRRLSKRSTGNASLSNDTQLAPLGPDDEFEYTSREDVDEAESRYVKTIRFNATTSTTTEQPEVVPTRRTARQRQARGLSHQHDEPSEEAKARPILTKKGKSSASENLSDKISLFQALEVRQERSESQVAAQDRLSGSPLGGPTEVSGEPSGPTQNLMCYQRIEIFAFLFTVASILLAAVSVTIGCYYRASNLKRVSLASSQHLQQQQQRQQRAKQQSRPLSLSRANVCYSPFSSESSSCYSISPGGSGSCASSASPPMGQSSPTAGPTGAGGLPVASPDHLLDGTHFVNQLLPHQHLSSNQKQRNSNANLNEMMPSNSKGAAGPLREHLGQQHYLDGAHPSSHRRLLMAAAASLAANPKRKSHSRG